MRSSTDLLIGGGLTPNISEYTSRDCRKALVHLAIQAIREKHREDVNFKRRNGEPLRRGGHNISPYGLLAKKFGLHRITVKDWVEKGLKPCNENTEKIINLLIELKYSDELLKILDEDLFTHRYSLGIIKDQAAGFAYPFAVSRGSYTKKAGVVA